jgi:hypothetical protein
VPVEIEMEHARKRIARKPVREVEPQPVGAVQGIVRIEQRPV